VLTIGATNLAQDLDQALLRPGRFEAVFEIPSPGDFYSMVEFTRALISLS